MGAPSKSWRALAGFLGVAAGVALLFTLVAMVALRPKDGLAWISVPDLGADLRVDAGLQTKPLKDTVVAAVLQDRALEGTTASGLSVAPALAVTPQPAVAINTSPAARPVTTPAPSQPGPTATPDPGPGPTPTPTAAPTPTPQFAIKWAGELVTKSKNGNGARCSQSTVTAVGGFTTNGVGGTVSYQWVRVDNQGNRTNGASGTIQVAAGDSNLHQVTSDIFTPVHSGSDQLVFLTPAYSVPAQSWTCVG